MVLPDVNILVYAHRRDMPDHRAYRDWLDAEVNSEAAFGLSDLVLSGFIRIVTHPRVFQVPTALADALVFASQLRNQPNRIGVAPGARHWGIFAELCTSSGARGNLVPDAYFAALAIEHGCEWITTDRDYSRFAGLNWRHPLAT